MSRLQSTLDRIALWLLRICLVTGTVGVLLIPPCYWVWGNPSWPLGIAGILLVISMVSGAFASACRTITRPGRFFW